MNKKTAFLSGFFIEKFSLKKKPLKKLSGFHKQTKNYIIIKNNIHFLRLI